MSLLINVILVLVIIGLLVWAVTLLSGLGLPPPVIIALQIVCILVGILYLLQMVGMVPALR